MAKSTIDFHEMFARSREKNIQPAKRIKVKTATAGERSNMPRRLKLKEMIWMTSVDVNGGLGPNKY